MPGDLAQAVGDAAAAGERCQASLGIAERPASTDPTNTQRQRDAQILRDRFAEVMVNSDVLS